MYHNLPPLPHKSKQTGLSSPRAVGCVSDLPQRAVLALIQPRVRGSLHFTGTEVA